MLKIKSTVESYIESKNVEKLYSLENFQLYWIIGIYEMDINDPINTVVTLKKAESYVLKEQLYSENHDFLHKDKKYRIVLNLQKGTDKDLDYFDPGMIST